MMASAFSRDTAPPSASQLSASPSSWKPPVSQTLAAIASPTATVAGNSCIAPHSTSAEQPPTTAPTSGK